MPHLDVCDPSDCRVAFISRGQPQAGASVASDANAVRWWQLSTLVTNRQPMARITASIADLCIHALYRLDLERVWIQSSLDRASLSIQRSTRVPQGGDTFSHIHNFRKTKPKPKPKPAPESSWPGGSVDQWISISGSVVEGAPTEEPRPDASNARSQRPATRAIGVSRALACVLKHPWLPTGALHCPGHPSCAGA
jgi:hypothetical protein